MQVIFPAGEAHAVQQADQSIVMIPMQMGYEYMSDLASPDLVPVHLDLGAFPAIHEEHALPRRHHLRSGVTVEHRECRIIAQDGDSQHVSGKRNR